MMNLSRRYVLEWGLGLVSIFIFSFLLNFVWEALHAVYLYQGHNFKATDYIPMVVYVASMDALMISGLYLATGLPWLDFNWIRNCQKKHLFVFAIGGIVMAVVIEDVSVLHFQRWAYNENMPTLFGIGISPLVQLSITGLLSLWNVGRLFYGKGIFNKRS